MLCDIGTDELYFYLYCEPSLELIVEVDGCNLTSKFEIGMKKSSDNYCCTYMQVQN